MIELLGIAIDINVVCGISITGIAGFILALLGLKER